MTLRRAAPVEPRWLQSGATPGNAEILAFLRDKRLYPERYGGCESAIVLPSTPAYTSYIAKYAGMHGISSHEKGEPQCSNIIRYYALSQCFLSFVRDCNGKREGWSNETSDPNRRHHDGPP
eukprot:3389739-Prymnesium_polylepis.2